MTFYIKTLASSSKGNSALIFTDNTKILIDIGISHRKIDQHLQDMGLSFKDIDALIITHAHSDHTKGLNTFIKKTNVPVYISETSLKVVSSKSANVAVRANPSRFLYYKQVPFTVNDLTIEPYALPHDGWLINRLDDAGDHFGFKFIYGDGNSVYSLGYATDLGHFPDELLPVYQNCDFYVIEANHDERLQMYSSRPMGLIKRNLSKFGHLSNNQTIDALGNLLMCGEESRRTKQVLLAHLSRECNTHELALSTVTEFLEQQGLTDIAVSTAPYDIPSELYRISMG